MQLKKKPVTGMKDILPREMEIRDYLIGLIKETYKQLGFTSMETPCVEHIENLTSKQGGDKEKLIPQLKESYGEIEVVKVPELEGGYGFVTPVMMEGDYETRSKLYKEQIVHMIRIQD